MVIPEGEAESELEVMSRFRGLGSADPLGEQRDGRD